MLSAQDLRGCDDKRQDKAQGLRKCDPPGAAAAKVARSHGINTSAVHGWRKLACEAGAAGAAPLPSVASQSNRAAAP
jgi:transposase-like protein